MKPLIAFWLGIGLIVASQAAQWLLVLAAELQAEQQQAGVDAVVTVVRMLGLLLPLGVGFVALSLIARAVLRARTVAGAATGEAPGGPARRDPFSPRVVLLCGIALVVLGLLVEQFLTGWQFGASANPGIARDVLNSLAPVVRAVALPLGILLIPCAWLLGIIASRTPDAGPPHEDSASASHHTPSGPGEERTR